MTRLDEIVRDAINTFGYKKQKTKAIEEMAELIKEVCKDILDQGDRDHICEEIADVRVMLYQLAKMYDYEGRIEHWFKFKIDRLSKTIEKENSGSFPEKDTETQGVQDEEKKD